MAELSQHVPTVVLNSLSGFGFEADDRNETCNHFITRLRNFVVRFCQFYEAEVDRELANPRCVKTRSDLVSWAINETTRILFEALGRYRAKIAEQEIVGSQKIRCEAALSYFVWLIEITEGVKNERKAAQEIIPLSTRFRKKRKSHPWTPYAVDVMFEELFRLFGTRR